MKIYSHSKLSTFEQCKLKYKFKYIDKIVPEVEKSIEAHLGSSVHLALEWLYKQVQQKNLPSLDDLIVKYIEFWQIDYSPNMVIVRDHLTEKDYLEKGMKFLIDYYQENKPFDDNTIELEKKITIDLSPDEEIKIIGYIDRLVQNLETGNLEIHDYKTANSQPRENHGEKDRQLALYSIAIKEMFGNDKPVVLVWHFLAHNRKITSTRTNEQLAQLKDETLELINKIESTNSFFPNKGPLCDWCEYKSICPAWGNSPDKPNNNTERFIPRRKWKYKKIRQSGLHEFGNEEEKIKEEDLED